MPKYLSTIAVTLLIIIAVMLPGSNLPSVDMVGFDKFVHFGMFAVWAIAVRYDLDPKAYRFHVVLLAGLFFSVLTEFLQILVEGRSFDIYDMIADAAGLVAGLLASSRVLVLLEKLNLTRKGRDRE